MWLCISFYPEHIVREHKGQINDSNRHVWLSNRVIVFAAGQKPVTNVYHIPKYLKIENGRMGYKANIHSRHLLYHDSWVKFKVFVLNNGSMSCHNITAFRIQPTLCFPVLRNTKSAGLKIFWHFWYAKHIYSANMSKSCMSKSSSNTMGFQLFNVLFIKVDGTRPVTGLTVQ